MTFVSQGGATSANLNAGVFFAITQNKLKFELLADHTRSKGVAWANPAILSDLTPIHRERDALPGGSCHLIQNPSQHVAQVVMSRFF
jgi:hypothetical protein